MRRSWLDKAGLPTPLVNRTRVNPPRRAVVLVAGPRNDSGTLAEVAEVIRDRLARALANAARLESLRTCASTASAAQQQRQ